MNTDVILLIIAVAGLLVTFATTLYLVGKAIQKELKRQEREQLRKAHRKRMEAADADDAAREADLEAMRLRQEAEDQVEFDKWRALISVEDAGIDADVVDSHKVVVLEDVAAEFGLRTEDARDRVAALVASGRLSGLLDDRGKFVSISDHEMNAVATYIRTQGRLTLHDLGRECNRLVRFD
ncbi:hypothetical protein DYB37_000498 [Aphanomyces astaci]|uniref:DDRGK domain-containing protein 1 n=1 Tax=Aphanomyces astaci TaxID=112090 RepID=A0A3R6WV89_APHAT|nr:hypothetical protein DYB35_001641 [Aphanomyces astaci]RHZ28856.1 hypothetical protein DYB37_000498 [Aphanomyces astaci]